MERKSKIFDQVGPSSPAIELANIELLREEGEVSRPILAIMTAYNSVRGFIERRRQKKIDQAERPSQRNPYLNRF